VSPLPLSAQAETRPHGHGPLLGSVLRLGEVEDVEAFVRKCLDDRLKAMGAFLNPVEHDDAVSFLIAETWELWQRYDPSKGPSFSTYAYRILWRRVASWYRQRYYDRRYRTKLTLLSLNENDELAGMLLEEPVLSEINVAALTPDGQQILVKLALPMVEEDLTLEQIGRRFGYGRHWSRAALERLRKELGPMLGEDQDNEWVGEP
jgi:RNA polymerase sigma factor (sigma-70 family)